MLGMKLVERVPNYEMKKKCKTGYQIAKLEWSWVGHVARRNYDRWSKVTAE